MKKLIVVALLVVGLTTFAQGKGKRGDFKEITPEKRTEMQVKKMTADLNLNEKQQKEVKELLNSQKEDRDEMMEKRKEMKETAEKATKEQREAMKAKMDKKKEAIDAKMKTILTGDQYKKWEATKEERKEKMGDRKEKMKEKRSNK
ncbi:MAG: protein CpxP [Flavobacterium sp.]|jgi:protein CpxP